MLHLDENARLNGEPVRYVALGDSFTEGVGDIDESRPNQVRGWADRVADAIGARDAQAQYANLAIRGYLMDQIMDEQLAPALELKPNLVSIYGGGNDIIRPNVDIDALVQRMDDTFALLRAEGIEVFTMTGLDILGEGPFARTRPRTALYNELIREVAENRGVHIVDYWRMRDFVDWRLWAPDKLHMNEYGHQKFAARVLSLMGLEGAVPEPQLPPAVELSRREELEQSARWVREHALPWVGRRIRGTSSGDGLQPKYAAFRPALYEPSARALGSGVGVPADKHAANAV